MKKLVFALILILSLTELLIMEVLLDWDFLSNFWLSVIFDATLVSVVANLTVYLFLHFNQLDDIKNHTEKILFGVTGIVFSLEALLMLLFLALPFSLTPSQETVLDVVILGVISPVLIYRLFLAPLSVSEDITDRVRQYSWSTVYLGILLCLLLVSVVSYKQRFEAVKHEVMESETIHLTLMERSIYNIIVNSLLDIAVLSNHLEFQHLKIERDHALLELKNAFLQTQKVKNYYHQIRFIDLEGQEIIRVDQHNGSPQIVDLSKLQNKSNRYYFQEGLRLKPNEIYISPLDLNIENGSIERPFRPMLRLVIKVRDELGDGLGIIVANLDAQVLLETIQFEDQSNVGSLMLLNEQGYWLYGGDERNWAFMFDDRKDQSFPTLLPDHWSETIDQWNGSVLKDDYIATFDRFGPFDGLRLEGSNGLFDAPYSVKWPNWLLVSQLPSAYFETRLKPYRNFLIALFILLGILFGSTLFWVSRAYKKKAAAEYKVLQMALYDNLTGLANRKHFTDRLTQELDRIGRYLTNAAVMYMDLDKFKPINDELGHLAGDAALKYTAMRLLQSVRKTDLVARIGGDEFVVVLPNPGNKENLEIIAQRIIDTVSQPMMLSGKQHNVGITIGICNVTEPGALPDEVVNRADIALYEGKDAGRNCYRFG